MFAPLSPSPYNAAVPKGPTFSFLNYYCLAQKVVEGSRVYIHCAICAYCLVVDCLRETLSEVWVGGRHRARRCRVGRHIREHATAATKCGWLLAGLPPPLRRASPSPRSVVQESVQGQDIWAWPWRRCWRHGVRSRRGGCASHEERSGLDAALAQRRLRRPLSSIYHNVAQSTVPES